MRIAFLCLAFLGTAVEASTASALASTQPPDPYTTISDAAFAKAFACPNPGAPLAEREFEIRSFMDWVSAHHGTWTIAQSIAFRLKLLGAHHCTQTLQNIRAHAEADRTQSASQEGLARFPSEQAGRNAAGSLLDTRYGDVQLRDVAAKGFAPDTNVNPEQAEDWTNGVEAYMRLDGYTNFKVTMHQTNDREFNAFLDAMTNQEGRTNMGRRSYASLLKSNRSSVDTAKIEPLPQTVPLPETASIGTRFIHKQFHVRPATPVDMQGESTRGVPAWQVTVLDGARDWRGSSPKSLPKFLADSPAAMRNEIALFLLHGDWIAVPKGWHVQSAVDAVTPSWGATFIAPGGSGQGWLAVGGSGPGMSEVFSGAEGYFQDAYRLEDVILPGSLARDAKLSPEPDSLTHPDPCTAIVSYGSGGLVVQGVKLFQPLTDSVDLSPYVRGIFIALPKNEATLQDYLVKVFQQEHPTVDCQKKAW